MAARHAQGIGRVARHGPAVARAPRGLRRPHDLRPLCGAAGNRALHHLVGLFPTAPARAHADLALAQARIDPRVRTTLGDRLGEDFSNVRIDTNLPSRDAEQGVAAVTEGERVTIAPQVLSGPAGLHVLAHELVHVVQARRRGLDGRAPRRVPVPRPSEHDRDPHEREADSLADQVMAGRPAVVPTSGAPVPTRQFGLLDDLKKKAKGVADWGENRVDRAGAWLGERKDEVQAALEEKAEELDTLATEAGEAFLTSGFVNAVSDAVDVSAEEIGNAVVGMGDVIMDPRGTLSALQSFVNLQENEFNEEQDQVAAQFKDDAVLGPLARANAWSNKLQNEVTMGFGQALLELGVATPTALAHPIETVQGLSELVKAIDPGQAAIDFAIDAILDAIEGEAPEGQKTHLEESWDRKTGAVLGLVEGYLHSIKRGKYGEVAGRGILDLVLFALPGDEAVRPATSAARATAEAGRTIGLGERLGNWASKARGWFTKVEEAPVKPRPKTPPVAASPKPPAVSADPVPGGLHQPAKPPREGIPPSARRPIEATAPRLESEVAVRSRAGAPTPVKTTQGPATAATNPAAASPPAYPSVAAGGGKVKIATQQVVEIGESGLPRQIHRLDDVTIGPAYSSIEEAAAAAGPDGHALEVVVTNEAGEVLGTWFEASEKGVGNSRVGKLLGHTEQKALLRTRLRPGIHVEMRGHLPPCTLASGCREALQVVADETGATITYRNLLRARDDASVTVFEPGGIAESIR